jgi:AcrR family transcriptional regulator
MATTADAAGRSPMRARFREQVRENVKAVALVQLADGGAGAVSVNAIAKELGVSGPALYRYFANRDELLAELVVDAYHDFAEALAAATHRDRGLAPPERLRALAAAWRAFARAEPHRYRLLFAPPLPGYDAHSAPLVAASREVMAVGLDVYADLSAPPAGVLSGWSRLHGFAGLEIGGNFTAMGIDADAVFGQEVDALVRDHDPAGIEEGGRSAAGEDHHR